MVERVAVVTGSNKGIGLVIVKNLCSQFDGIVYLTARDEARGKKAVEELKKEGLNPAFHQLDITDKDSINKFASFIKTKHGGLDVLVNNAGIYDPDSPLLVQVENSLKTNYYAVKDVSTALYPLLRSHARVVTVSSGAGQLSRVIKDEGLRKRFSDPGLTEEGIDKLLIEYTNAVKDGTYEEKGWPAGPTTAYSVSKLAVSALARGPTTAYSVSKLAVSALARVHHRQFLNDQRRDIVINHVCPGFTATDLNGHKGVLTVEQGAEAPTYAALLPKNCQSPRGDFVGFNKQIFDWVNGPDAPGF